MNKEQAAKEYHTVKIYGETDGNRVHELVDAAFIAGATWQEQPTHPHSTYMEFAEWFRVHTGWIRDGLYFYNRQEFTTPDLFQYWIDNVKNKQY